MFRTAATCAAACATIVVSSSSPAFAQCTHGDLDGNREVSLADHALLVGCITGPGTTAAPGTCDAVDFDTDRHVDLADLAVAQRIFGEVLGAPFVHEQIELSLHADGGFALGDLDGDGDTDIATADRRDSLTVWINAEEGGFFEAVTYPVGLLPFAPVASDVDGDDALDLLFVLGESVTSHGDAVAVLFNNGDGTFELGGTFSSPSCQSIVLADLDGDDDQDVISAASWRYIDVTFNNGTGSFTNQTRYDIGGDSYDVHLADLDSDGDIDIAAAGQETTAFLLNDGAGVFATAPWAVSEVDRLRCVADLDADGDADLVVAESAGVRVLLNEGDGSFVAGEHVVVVSTRDRVIAADLDGDSDPDLAVFTLLGLYEPGYGAIAVLMNHSDGTFGDPAYYQAGDRRLAAPAAADVSGDGILDLVAVSGRGATLSMLINRGDGRFVDEHRVRLDRHALLLANADLDRDGAADLIVADGSDHHIQVLRRNASGEFVTAMELPTAGAAWQVTVGDLDGNGSDDLVAMVAADEALAVFLNQGDGLMGAPITYNVSGSVTIGEFDHAAGPDLAIINDGEVMVLFNNGTGSFGYTAGADPGNEAGRPVPHDLNGDGLADLVLNHRDHFRVLANEGNGTFAEMGSYCEDCVIYGLAMADFNGDGLDDVAVTDARPANVAWATPGCVAVYLNRGDGTLGVEPIGEEPPESNARYSIGADPDTMVAADVTGDARPDLVITNLNRSSVSVLVNNGDGTFADEVRMEAGEGPTRVIAADLDGDGDRDIAAATMGQEFEISILFNQCIP